MTDRVYNVLFLCTGNTASFHPGGKYPAQGRCRPLQCIFGRQPTKGVVNHLALKVLAAMDYGTAFARSHGTSLPWQALPSWISSSPSATAPLAKLARCGRGNR